MNTLNIIAAIARWQGTDRVWARDAPMVYRPLSNPLPLWTCKSPCVRPIPFHAPLSSRSEFIHTHGPEDIEFHKICDYRYSANEQISLRSKARHDTRTKVQWCVTAWQPNTATLSLLLLLLSIPSSPCVAHRLVMTLRRRNTAPEVVLAERGDGRGKSKVS